MIQYDFFNSGISPHYYGFYAPLLKRGVVIVEAGIRGGDEYGEKWHEGGMLGNKQNCFDDFNACAEWLVKEKYTTTDKIVAEGRLFALHRRGVGHHQVVAALTGRVDAEIRVAGRRDRPVSAHRRLKGRPLGACHDLHVLQRDENAIDWLLDNDDENDDERDRAANIVPSDMDCFWLDVDDGATKAH